MSVVWRDIYKKKKTKQNKIQKLSKTEVEHQARRMIKKQRKTKKQMLVLQNKHQNKNMKKLFKKFNNTIKTLHQKLFRTQMNMFNYIDKHQMNFNQKIKYFIKNLQIKWLLKTNQNLEKLKSSMMTITSLINITI